MDAINLLGGTGIRFMPLSESDAGVLCVPFGTSPRYRTDDMAVRGRSCHSSLVLNEPGNRRLISKILRRDGRPLCALMSVLSIGLSRLG